ncbi:lymphotoxin-beta isoform X1 [Sagmatias obliquidens]|uniref:lymphotoxin-beta isoform X1 n=1 Tax=Sagmatias obliquidens TaxID=3371155 RepID=UPI000F43F89C|nr:lymphotoxin-beta isoform X1 [Lagenorhynchus obliquidens]
MGALGLECRGRRPQGKGCLLLAVAGAASLVTLLLAVPITVLAVLALVPQEQGGLVTGTADPGAQAQAHQRFGIQVPHPWALAPCPLKVTTRGWLPCPQPWTLRPFQSPGSCRWRRRQKQISAPGSRLPTSLRERHDPAPPARLDSCSGLKAPTVPQAHPPRSPRPGSLLSGSDFREPTGPFLRRRLDHGAGARLGGEERRGVSEERDAVLGRRGAGPPAGWPLLPLLSRRLPGPGAPSRRGPPGPLRHAAQSPVPGGGRLWIGESRATARGRGDREPGLGPRPEARVRASLVHERGVRRPGAAPEGREGVRQYQSPRYGGLQERKDLLWGGDGGVRATRVPKTTTAWWEYVNESA